MKKLNQKGTIDYMFLGLIVLIAVVGFFVVQRLGETDKTVDETSNSVDSVITTEEANKSKESADETTTPEVEDAAGTEGESNL